MSPCPIPEGGRDFEEYLIPRSLWAAKRIEHYANLELPLEADEYLARLND